MKSYTIYDVHLNRNTKNFNGCEIVVDGEHGRDSFPGTWATCDARAHYRAGIPWNVPTPEAHTYIVALDSQYYALAADTLMTTIYAIGSDRKPDSLNAVCFTGSIDARNDAIRSVCTPHTWQEAIRIAKSNGEYIGQLYDS